MSEPRWEGVANAAISAMQEDHEDNIRLRSALRRAIDAADRWCLCACASRDHDLDDIRYLVQEGVE